MDLRLDGISCDVVHRVVSDVQHERDCIAADARIRLMGAVPASLLTPVELARAAYFLSL